MKKNYLIFLLAFFTSHNFAQQRDSLQIENTPLEFQYKKTFVPAGLMLTSLIASGKSEKSWNNTIKAKRNENIPNFYTRADDLLVILPMAGIYGFELAGMTPKTDWKNRSAILFKGNMLTFGFVYVLKNTLKETRPDGTSLSFPSGHSAFAFSGATMLAIEYGEHHKWVPYAAYGVASTVGVLRIANNRHYLSDVLFGAGLGILSMKVAYWTHQYKWNQPKSTVDPYAGILY